MSTRAPGRPAEARSPVGAASGRTYGDVLAESPLEAREARKDRRANELEARQVRQLEAGRRRAVDPRVPALLDTPRRSFPRKEQLGTSCSIQPDLGPDLGAPDQVQLADDVGAHVFRHEVARFLAPLWSRRAHALVSCGEAGARCDCGDCGTPHVLPYRCGARSCPTCAYAASAIVGDRVAARSELALETLAMAATWEGPRRKGDTINRPRKKTWKMLTLTTQAAATAELRYDPDTLRRYVLEVRKAIGPFWRSTSWGRRINDVSASGRPTKRARRDTIYIAGIEVAPGGMVHAHLAVYGEYISSEHLRACWTSACDVGGNIKVNAMRVPDAAGFRKGLREVLKYVTKGDKNPGQRAARAAVVEYALRRVRRIEVGGALRMIPALTAKDVATNGRKCETCGGGASWRWRGMRAPEYVRANKGFGVSRIVDDADAAVILLAKRAEGMTEQQLARELARARVHEYRPGGKFYGGSPPPWWDDADEWDTLEDRAPLEWMTPE